MARALLLPAVGVVDGGNRVFEAPADFSPGSLRVGVNSVPSSLDDNDAEGWVELDTRRFEMRVAPQVGDVVFVWQRLL